MAKKKKPLAPSIAKIERLTCAICGMSAPRGMIRGAPEPSLVRCVNAIACRKRARHKPRLELMRESAKAAAKRGRS